MSRFADRRIENISPYVPGEQPRDRKYIKLNTNENPYYASAYAVSAVDGELLLNLKRYSDPECRDLASAIADFYGVQSDQIMITNGSDEALAFAFYAYCRQGVCFADVTYGFYEVIARLFGCPVEKISLDEQFKIVPDNYFYKGKSVVIANPNAQTGIALGGDKIEEIIAKNADNIVIIDQAYADFGEFNAIELTKKYDNLVTVNTFSKSRSLAGARVGYIIADRRLIEDLKKVKNSFHPYNVNTVSQLLAARAMEDREYFLSCMEKIKATRASFAEQLIARGFEVLPSSANFVLARSPKTDGKSLYESLRAKGILVRHFNDERIAEYIRITIGTDAEMGRLLSAIDQITGENNEKS